MMRLRSSVLVALLLTAASQAGLAQVSRLAGIVRDEAGKPVGAATITALSTSTPPVSIAASTDEKGRFSIAGLAQGAWTLVVEAPGFQPARLNAKMPPARSAENLAVTLQRGAPAPAGPGPDVTGTELQGLIDAAE